MSKNNEVTPEVEETLEKTIEENIPTRDTDPEPEYVPAYQVVNDRQNILTDKIPPKIMSLEALISEGVINETGLAKYLEDNGYVKNTDYASGSTAGVIIASNSYGLSTTSNGSLVGATRNASQYDANSGNMIISKGTLENIKLSLVLQSLSALADSVAPDAVDGTVVSGLYATRQGGEWLIGFGTITPPATP